MEYISDNLINLKRDLKRKESKNLKKENISYEN